MTHEQELLARAISHIDDDMLLAARAPRKKARRVVPVAVAACLLAAIIASFPYLRTVINTNSDLFGPGDEVNQEDAGSLSPEEYPYAEMGTPVSLGGTTLTLIATTDTTATFTVVKTDDTPLYAMLYDLRENALASTEPDYKADGVTIRPNTIRLYINGEAQPAYKLPKAPGTYEVTVDFSIIRNGTYPMREYVGFYAYIGKDGEAVTERFSLQEISADTEGTSTDTAETDHTPQ